MGDYSVFDDLPIGVQVISEDLRYLYINHQLSTEVGRPAAELVGARMVDCFAGIDTTDIYREIQLCLADGQPRTPVNEFTFEDGRITYYQLELYRVAEGVLIQSRDITETEAGVRLLRETAKNQAHFAHLAAHDMREPVRRMMLLSEALTLDFADELPAPATALCRQLHQQSQQLMQLIDDFRSLSSIESKRSREKQTVALRTVLEDAIAPFQARFTEAGMDVHRPEAELELQAHSTMVGILFRNLLENALLHGRDELTITVDHTVGPAIITVSNPTSLPPLSSDPLLPFVGHDRARGTGLGLAIAKRVVSHHDGTISATQEDQRFTVRFTLAPGGRLA